jgi:hypothetical protein
MNALRAARNLPRLVLAWFALSIFAAIASPVIHPQSMELICSSGSGAVKVLIKTEDGVQKLSTHTLDCPLCISAGAPPPMEVHFNAELVQRAPYLLQTNSSAKTVWLTGAPLPARGPPVLS